jgi:hypothetical protein
VSLISVRRLAFDPRTRMIGADARVQTSALTHACPPRTIRRSIGGPALRPRVRERKTAGLFKIAHPSNSRNLSGCIEGKLSTRSQNAPECSRTPSREPSHAKTTELLFRFAHPRKKTQPRPHPVRLFKPLISGDASNPADEDKEKRGAFPESKTRHGVVTSEASPRLVQKSGGRFSLCVRSVAM